MEKSFLEILEQTINYLRFQRDYGNLYFYEEKIKLSKNLYDKEPKNMQYEFKSEKGLEKVIAVKEESNSVLFPQPWQKAESISVLDKMICECKNCRLGNLRKNFVFGTGNPEAKVVLVGEAPGADEDREGKPFVGRAGKLLTDILSAIKFSRDEVFICNILKCRPPENRNPLPDEIKECEPYLIKQLELLKPSLILALGTFAAQTLLRSNLPLGKLRGKFYDYTINDRKIKLLVTYHPAALLRNPNWKKPTWEDVQLFRKEYDLIYS